MFFFFNDTATTEIYTLSLHDALPISAGPPEFAFLGRSNVGKSSLINSLLQQKLAHVSSTPGKTDRKSTRLNSSHANISYAVFCLKKKTKKTIVNSHYNNIEEEHNHNK